MVNSELVFSLFVMGMVIFERSNLASACRRPPKPINCKWGRWVWLPCSASCGGGQKIGSRIVVQTAMYGGKTCNGPHIQVQPCNNRCCDCDFTLIVGGSNGGGGSNSAFSAVVEVVSPEPLSHEVPKCIKTLGKFPTGISGAFGTTFDNVPHICGGTTSDSPSTFSTCITQCWKLDGQTGRWSRAGRMNQCRGGGAGAHHPQLGFLVSGGGRFSVYSTTEISKDGRTFSTFTPLGNATGPTKRCCVALDGDDGEFFLAGGTGWGYVSSTAFIHRRGQWDEVEPIPTARYSMMCGPVRDSPGGKVRKIVAAGGGWFRGGGPLNIVEVYDISLNTWETGTSLPHGLTSAAVVEYDNTFNIIGGYSGNDIWSDKILRYDSDGEQWIELPTTMTEGKSGLIAIKTKASFFKTC